MAQVWLKIVSLTIQAFNVAFHTFKNSKQNKIINTTAMNKETYNATDTQTAAVTKENNGNNT